MPTLNIYQSMWGMEFNQPDGFQWQLQEKISRIADSGFYGVSFDFPHHNKNFIEQAQPLLKQFGLACVFNVFVSNSNDFQDLVDWAKTLDCPPECIGIIGQVPPWDVNAIAEQTRDWLSIGNLAGFATYVEAHRNCMTNDLLFTLQLMDKVPELSMVADLSHVLLNQEWYLPISQEASALVSGVLNRTQVFHGRVGTREQAQIALAFPQNQPWFELFKSWWLEGFETWIQQNTDSEKACAFVCELGPPPYAITGPDGFELSDRWQEALLLKQTAESLWQQAIEAVNKNSMKTKEAVL